MDSILCLHSTIDVLDGCCDHFTGKNVSMLYFYKMSDKLQTLVYVAKMKSLYIVKGGFYLPFDIGMLLICFFFSIDILTNYKFRVFEEQHLNLKVACFDV